MIERNTSKAHAELDLATAATLFDAEMSDKKLSGELITSAFDLYSVETLRDRHKLRVGDTFPTDVFVFGKGEPDDPACTKVGGRPFWPDDMEWPNASTGSPCRFLAQFNFGDSMDIIDADLPGTILLLLTENEDDWLWGDDGLTFHWVSAAATPRRDLNVLSAVGSAGPFYGVRYRSADYPAAGDATYELDVSQGYNLPILNGTKIGGLPHFIQSGDDSPGQFLCQLGSIQAAPYAPFPWSNHRDALDLQFNDKGIYGDDNCAVFGDMGSVYLFVDDDGNVSRSFECY
ncbi:DUF1963 domain-containing protein [Adhaeretor mobilis]|uniref:DUF1963 domain-containing protein n=1 Tax=Adhaeretor mobilis TaxID=1930276 RepID=A0A517N2I3_9BACT|nr:DUF1963 domain-containing protein [Adhaeretor mobilis]QDT01342.1 hypothetical protein HG15A2_46840 [Adhaeretor mobilis]